MPTCYSTESGLTLMVQELIADKSLDSGGSRDLAAIRDEEIRVTAVLCSRESDGEVKKTKGKPVLVRKVTDLELALTPKLGHFLLIVDHGTFDAASEHQQRAMLYDALLLIEVVHTDVGIKLGKRPPDLVMNADTIRAFGICDPVTLNISDAVRHAQKHTHLLIGESDVADESKGKSKSKKGKRTPPEVDASEEVETDGETEPVDNGEPTADDVDGDEVDGAAEEASEDELKRPARRRR